MDNASLAAGSEFRAAGMPDERSVHRAVPAMIVLAIAIAAHLGFDYLVNPRQIPGNGSAAEVARPCLAAGIALSQPVLLALLAVLGPGPLIVRATFVLAVFIVLHVLWVQVLWGGTESLGRRCRQPLPTIRSR